MLRKRVTLILIIFLLFSGLALFLFFKFGRKEVGDTQAPTVPSGLVADVLSPFEMKVSWRPSKDDRAVVEYRVYQGKALIESVKTTSVSYRGLTPDSTYCYNISAFDGAGNESKLSEEVCAKTPAILIAEPVIKPKVAKAAAPKLVAKRAPLPPEPPAGIKARPLSTTEIGLTWNPSKSELGIAGYNIYREGTLHKTVTTASASYTGLTPQTTYCYTISAVDTAGNESIKSKEVCATTLALLDKGPPTPPLLKAEVVSPTEISLSWSGARDDRGVTGYNLYQKGALIRTEKSTSFLHTRLKPNTRYCYNVTAFDAAGNESISSNEVCPLTSSMPDRTAPTIPSGFTAIATSPTQVDLSWSPSTDDIEVKGYNLYKDGVFLQSVRTTSASHTGAIDTTSCYTVSAVDEEGNESEKSRQVCVITKFVAEKGTVWTGGVNDYGQLGDGTTISKNTLIQVSGLSNIIKVAAGMEHTVALKKDGTVLTWGRNNKGQLGDGSSSDKHTPVNVKGISDVIDISAGWYHTVALKKDGTVLTWGRNYYGQLGDGSNVDRTSPIQVRGLSDVMAVAAGWYHTVAVKKDGSVWTWGWNLKGQLGDGTTDDSNIPIQVRNIKDVVSVVAGQHHTVALSKDGGVWAWGGNDSGQLGNGTTSPDRYMPQEVPGLKGVTAIAAGGAYTITLKKDGTLWAWGANDYGQLGLGSTMPKNIPTKLDAISDVELISAGMKQTVALKKDGTLWAWGELKGQKQKGFLPVRISGISNITEVSAGMAHIVALKSE